MFELFAMEVCPEFQWQGVGRQIVSHALDGARLEGAKKAVKAVAPGVALPRNRDPP
jgi:GNAT superfamily N-acetyltransferase